MRVSRFEVSGTNPPRCDPRTERVVYEWPSRWHDGGCLAFGPDNCLYIGAGAGGGTAAGQDLGDASGSILRIDVDHPQQGRGYGIPRDNPFRNVPGALPEIWAYGLRQPWRFSIDRRSGAVWVGDVGQDLWEMIVLAERGGNYGWNVMEGSHPFRPEQKRGPTPIRPPIVEHSHAEARSITGGSIYRGTRLEELVGAYLYGDYDTGKSPTRSARGSTWACSRNPCPHRPRSCRGWPILRTGARAWIVAHAPISTPTARTAIAPSGAVTPSSSCSGRSTSPRRGPSKLAPRKGTSASPMPGSSRPATRGDR
ncbi:MAG TPA: PQQ-dependent sugar dehydrogenase [Isosphaeraceae bacterium]|nr:PQQ-dependent sugar dehydrogenase [Isosphaeraceae bacterium]